jgi:Replication-relaxation
MTALITARRLAALRSGLSDRDWQIITTLARVRVATAAQLEWLWFADVSRRRVQQRLTALTKRRVIARLPRVIGGVRAGSRGHTYALDIAGARLAELGQGRRSRSPRPVGLPYLTHALSITEVFTEIVLAERAGLLQLARFTAEPNCWRSFYGPGGVRTTLKPDGHAVVRLDEYEDHWFLEVDQGTESAATIARKLEVYRAYWASGTEQARTDLFPLVLWLVPDTARAQVIRTAIARVPVEAQGLFVVALQRDAVTRLRQGVT